MAFFIAIFTYPAYIRFLQYLKVNKTIRDQAVTGEASPIFTALHAHKGGTPTMGGGMFLIVMIVMILLSLLLQNMDSILSWFSMSSRKEKYDLTYNLINRRETYIVLFSFFSMGILGLVDDYINVKSTAGKKGLSATAKLIGMFLFAGFIAYRFWIPLGHHSINFWPFAGDIQLGRFFPIVMFFGVIAITNAINITDGLDGLVGGLMTIILSVLVVMTIYVQWYLAATVIAIVIAALLAFLWFNINPARVFMGDSGSFCLGGLVASIVYLLNLKIGILIPFMVLFGIVRADFLSSALQIFRKKTFKRKLFPVAPFHHWLEHRGMKEHTIVMKLWLVQGVLAAISLILFFYQIH